MRVDSFNKFKLFSMQFRRFIFSSCFLFFFFPVFLFSQVSLNVVLDGGAIGDGITDDTDAIQSVFDQIEAAGGGTVFFPEGVYLVSPVENDDPIQVICLDLPANVEIIGAGIDLSTIRLADDVGNYDAIFGNFPSYLVLDNLEMRDLTIDGNALQNQVLDESVLNSEGQRILFRIYLGQNHLIENCRFTDSQGVWNIAYNGICKDVVIRNNIFDNIGGDVADWDHSTIYTNGEHFLIENNSFSSRFGAGTLGARTAIEIHGENQIIRDNFILGYSYGINATGYSDFYFSRNQFYYNNTFQEVMEGIVLWSGFLTDLNFANGLGNIAIFDNNISINADGWNDWEFSTGGAGIAFERRRERPIDSLFIFKNKIEFTGPPLTVVDDVVRSSGIVMASNVLDLSVSVNDFYLLKNDIRNANGAGIYLESKITNAIIGGNTITNAGSGTAEIYTGFRSGLVLNNALSSIQISCNEFDNDSPSAILDNETFENSRKNGQSYYFGNNIYDLNISGFFVGPDAEGESWNTEPNKPVVSFEMDSLAISAEQSSIVNLTLTEEVTNDLTISLFPICGNNKYGEEWELNQLEVVIPAGSATAELEIFNLLSAGDIASPAYLLISISPDYLLGCNPLLEINLNDNITSIQNNQESDEENLQVFPNPSKDLIFINDLKGHDVQISLFDSSGRLVFSKQHFRNNSLNISMYPSGLYFLNINDSGALKCTKFLIVR